MKRQAKPFALCLENAGNEASLILGKAYRILPDARAAKDDLVRIVDESGDDYLFDRGDFPYSRSPASGVQFASRRSSVRLSGVASGW